MLKKELCIKCWNKFGMSWIYGENYWKAGYVYCPPENIDKGERYYRNTTGEPPIKCPFILEQTI